MSDSLFALEVGLAIASSGMCAHFSNKEKKRVLELIASIICILVLSVTLLLLANFEEILPLWQSFFAFPVLPALTTTILLLDWRKDKKLSVPPDPEQNPCPCPFAFSSFFAKGNGKN